MPSALPISKRVAGGLPILSARACRRFAPVEVALSQWPPRLGSGMANRADCKRLRNFRQPQETTPGPADSASYPSVERTKHEYWCLFHPQSRVWLRGPKSLSRTKSKQPQSLPPPGVAVTAPSYLAPSYYLKNSARRQTSWCQLPHAKHRVHTTGQSGFVLRVSSALRNFYLTC